MEGEKLHKTFCAQCFGGLKFTEMRRNTVSHVMYAKEWEIHLEEMKCL